MESKGESVGHFWTEILGETAKPELLAWRGEGPPDVGEDRSVFYQGWWRRVHVSGWTSVLPGYDLLHVVYFWPPSPTPPMPGFAEA